MALVNDRSVWRWVEHPSEPDTKFHLRPLTDDEYQDALDARFDQTMDKAKSMGPDIMRVVREGEQEARKTNTTLEEVHAATAIKYALQEWTYKVECDDENKAQLDRATQEFLKGVIVEMNGPRPLSTSPLSNGNSNKEELSQSLLEPTDSIPAK